MILPSSQREDEPQPDDVPQLEDEPQPDDGPPSDNEQQAVEEEPRGMITRSKARELARRSQAMFMEEELGGAAARSLFNIHTQA
ncbi:unnamed protein product [Cochlearia groenlandica]